MFVEIIYVIRPLVWIIKMKSYKNRIFLERVVRFSPMEYGVDFTDESETNFHISIQDLVRLYEGTKFQMEKKGIDWDLFCNNLFKQKGK